MKYEFNCCFCYAIKMVIVKNMLFNSSYFRKSKIYRFLKFNLLSPIFCLEETRIFMNSKNIYVLMNEINYLTL